MGRSESKRRERPLDAAVQRGCLVISIGVEALAHAVRTSPDDRLTSYNEVTRSFRHTKITDPDLFAVEVVRALQAEEEDGNTLLHKMFDDAAVRAIEEGADGVDYDGESEP